MRYLVLIFVSISILFSNANAAPPPVEAYAQLPAIWDGAISPDGSKIAILQENDGEYILRVIDVQDMGAPVKAIALNKDIFPNWIKWANNNRILMSVKASERAGNTTPIYSTNIITVNSDLSDPDILLPQSRQFNDYVISWLPNDPQHILMGFSDDRPNETDVQKVDVVSGRYKTVRPGSANTQTWMTDSTGLVRLAQGRRGFDGEYRLQISPAGTDRFDANETFPDLPASSKIWGFTDDPNELIVARYGEGDTLGVWLYDLRKKAYSKKLFQHPEYDASGVMRSSDSRRVLGVTYIAADTEVEFVDNDAKALMNVIRQEAEGYTIRFLEQTSDGDRTLIWASSPDSPTLLLLYDKSENSIDLIGSRYPGLDNVQNAYVQEVNYTARDGQTIPAFVTIPAKAMDSGNIKSLPYIIFPHGGPQARDTGTFDYMAQLMASRGYGVLQINFRGSTGYGAEFRDAGRDNWVLMQEDVEDGTRWLVEKGYADKNRICIMGWSYGGFAALMGAAKTGELYQCAASIAGVTDLANLMTDMRKYKGGRGLAKEFILRGFEDKDDIKENSPVRLAGSIKIPVFLAHGKDDVTVHYDHFTRMEKELKKEGVMTTAIGIKGGDHSLLTVGKERIAMMESLVEFMEDNLGTSEWAND